MKVDHKPEIAPFNKNPPKAGGVFLFLVVWAVAPLRPCQGRAHTTNENKIPRLLFGIF